MRTTVRLEDALLEQAKREAARRGKTPTAPVEPRRKRARPRVALPVCRLGGGVLPGVDLDDGSALLDRMEGRT
jgi:hypothetical protein